MTFNFREATDHYTGYLESGEKVRISEKSGAVIPKPSTEDMNRIIRKKDMSKIDSYE